MTAATKDTPGEEALDPSQQHVRTTPIDSAPSFPVIGIGASAGGLAAFEAFFSAMPADTELRMAFVLVQHLAPDHHSILAELVRRFTGMQVFDVEDGMQVQAGSVYIIPPNRDIALLDGALRLSELGDSRGRRSSIDFFFKSLAGAQRERAVCIVLSGTGSDGSEGVRAVKAAGGMVMAQNPESTEYDGMPRSAIATGLVDYVLPPAEMPARLLSHASHHSHLPGPSAASRGQEDPDLSEVFALLNEHTNHDFSQYKQSTISRRVERRMAARQTATLADYVSCLRESPAEVSALFGDLLIGVTSFFRDPEAFAVLESRVIPQLLASKPADTALRVWVPGCSTGEEAYSLAMLMLEGMDALSSRQLKLQVFATDIDPVAIATARLGVYPASIAASVSALRLARWFSVQEDGGYRVKKGLREALIFSEQDVTKDPPFSNLDLISCRNLMIYMGPELHKRLMPLFHYALCPAGVLFLGTSETVGEFGHLFATTDRKAKVYQRKDDEYGAARPLLGKVPRAGAIPATRVRPLPSSAPQPSCREIVERGLLEDSPVAVLINARGELLYLHGHTGQYLQPAPGDAGLNILRMAREGLRHDLTTALHKAVSGRESVFRPRLRVKTNGDFSFVDLTVRPAASLPKPGEPELFLVIFEPAPTPPASAEPTAAAGSAEAVGESPGAARRVLELEQELRTKDEYLHATHEEMQTSNEELRAANEELQSTNEELQSSNEELETSKEELQSVNEELATVNAELQSKVASLSMANNDMNNLLAGTGVGTIFVDMQLRVRRFTPAATQFINLIQTDVGRPIGHIASNLVNYPGLLSDVQSVLDTLAPASVEVCTQSGTWFLLRIMPYRTTENAVEGAVITFTEVTAVKDLEKALQESEKLRRQVGALRDAQDAITVQNLEGRILAWNPGAVRMYGWTEAEALAMNIRAAVPPGEREQALATVQQLARAEVLKPFRAQRLTKDGKLVTVTLTATALVSAAGAVYAFSTTERGMTN